MVSLSDYFEMILDSRIHGWKSQAPGKALKVLPGARNRKGGQEILAINIMKG